MVNRFRGLPRLTKIALATVSTLLVACLLCTGFGLWYSSTPAYKQHATETAEARASATVYTGSRSIEIALPTSTVVDPATSTPSPTETKPAATSAPPSATPTIAGTPSATATRPSAPASPTAAASPTSRPTLAPTRPAPTIGPTNTPRPTIAPTSPPVVSGYVCPGGQACIKGNISSSGEKIYHFPGCASYNQTQIDVSKGERWFATESEALAAGWRRALNCP